MLSKIFLGVFSIFLSTSVFASDWVVKKEIPSEWTNIISKIGAYNEWAYLNESQRFDTNWPSALDFNKTQSSFQEKCVRNGILQESLRAILANSSLVIRSAEIIGKNTADYDADFFLIEMTDDKGNTYYGLTEHPLLILNGSLTAQCLSASSPARR